MQTLQPALVLNLPQVLVDAHGNALDLVTATVADSYVLLVVSPGAAESAVSLLKAAAAEAEMKVQVQDVSQRTVLLTLVGPESENVLKELAGEVSRVCGAAGEGQ